MGSKGIPSRKNRFCNPLRLETYLVILKFSHNFLSILKLWYKNLKSLQKVKKYWNNIL